MTVSGIHSCCR